MSHYHKPRILRDTYFFTARLNDKNSDLLMREIDRLRAATRATKMRFPFTIDAIVILPSTIHTIWTLPEGDADVSTRWNMLKSTFSKGLSLSRKHTNDQTNRSEQDVWQRRFWEHTIRDPEDFIAHINYIHAAPVKAGLVTSEKQWQHSSIHRAQQPTRSPVKHMASHQAFYQAAHSASFDAALSS